MIIRRKGNVARKTVLLFLVFLFLMSTVNLNVAAQAGEKRVLALYKSSENMDKSNNPAAKSFGSLFNKMGYKVDYVDAISQLPGEAEMKKYSVVISYFLTPVHPRPKQYLEWLTEQVYRRKKVIIIGNLGAHTTDNQTWLSATELNEFLIPFGLTFGRSLRIDNPAAYKIENRSPRIITSLPSPLPEHVILYNKLSGSVAEYITLNSGESGKKESGIISARTPYGAIIQPGFIETSSGEVGKTKWHFDREAFLVDVLTAKSALPVPSKKILGLYKGSEKFTNANNLIRIFAEEPLFKLGYSVDYHDIDHGIPTREMMNGYSGIITWYTGPEMRSAGKYTDWLVSLLYENKKIIIMENFGAYSDIIEHEGVQTSRFLDESEINNFFYPFGLQMDRHWTSDSQLVKIVELNSGMINKEVLDRPDFKKSYFRFQSSRPDNETYLSLKRTDIPGSFSDVIAVTPFGGMALQGYVFKQDPATWETFFVLNIPSFLAKCLEPAKNKGIESFEIKVDTQAEMGKALRDSEKNRFLVEEPVGIPESRKVLVLYKKSEGKDVENTAFYIKSGIILNHLGLAADYIDIESEKPGDEKMSEYRGIISWFDSEQMKNADEFNQWLLHQIDMGKKVVILGNYGALYDLDTFARSAGAQDVFSRMGIQLIGDFEYLKKNFRNLRTIMLTSRPVSPGDIFADERMIPGRPDRSGIVEIENIVAGFDERFFGFEAPFSPKKIGYITPIRSISGDNHVLLTIESGIYGTTTPAIIGSWGSCMLGDYFFQQFELGPYDRIKDYNEFLNAQFKNTHFRPKDYGRWVVDPFLFFTKALELEDIPRLDYTTLNGQRILYSHIDGDGLINLSEVEPLKYCGEIIREEVLKKYNVPITASIITNEMIRFGSKHFNRPLKVARSIFTLDNVEVGSHTHNHPFNYSSGDASVEIGNTGSGNYNITYKLPDPEIEILYSTALMNQKVAPSDKQMKIVLWSGLCNPTSNVLEKTDVLGLMNINGGDPAYSRSQKSYSNISPILTRKKNTIQVHTSASNDYIYTEEWTGNFDGMKNLLEYFHLTDTPRRVVPLNIYYHYYSGAYHDSLNALKLVYDYCLKQPIAPIFTSQYAKIVNDFYHSKTARTDDGGFIVNNAGYLRTIRFDNSRRVPDLLRSVGIIGFNYHNDSLYVFLDETKHHVIYLTDSPQKKVYLVSASHYVSNWNVSESGVKAVLEGLGAGMLEIANLVPNRTYEVLIGGIKQNVTTDNAGKLAIRYEFVGKPTNYELEVRLK
jgi:polysaccharide biosynthesis protein PelA